jgi:hypothetical protein
MSRWRSDFSVSVVSGPAAEVVSVEDAKLYTKIDASADDALVSLFAASAREYCETWTRRAFTTQTLEASYRGWPWCGAPLILPRPPLQQVSKVEYIDTDGVRRELSSSAYVVTAPAGPRASHGTLDIARGVSLPALGAVERPVIVTLIAGYGDAAEDVPEGLRSAVLVHLCDLHMNRGTGDADAWPAVERLLRPYRVSLGAL